MNIDLKLLSQKLPHASDSFKRLNPALFPEFNLPVQDHDPTPTAQLKRRARARPLAKSQIEESNPAFYLVRVKSFRRRLLDTDNLVPKFHVDALRYAGILQADSPDRARIETSQEKVGSKAEERTEIEISLITPQF